MHKCDRNATCINFIGYYTCKCKSDFRGNGFHCEEIDHCLVRFGTECVPNAHCDSTSIELPECVCNEGFHGDGRRSCIMDGDDDGINVFL